MKLSRLAIPVVALGALAGVLLLSRKPSAKDAAASDARVGAGLIDSSLLGAATSLRLSGENNQVATLRKSADNTWVVEEFHNLPIDFEKLTRLTRDLEKAKVSRFVTANPDRVKRLELDKTSLTVTAEGKPEWKLAIGKNADGGGRFVRFGSDANVYQTDFDAWLDTTARGWAAQELTKFQAGDVRSLELAFPDGRKAGFSRDAKDAAFKPADGTLPEGATLKADAINTLLGSLGSLRFSEVAANTDEPVTVAREKAVEYTVGLFNGTKLSVKVGRKPAPPAKPAETPAPAADGKPAEAKPAEPAPQPGPVYAFVKSSDEKAPINAMMAARAFSIGDWIFNQLPTGPEHFYDKPAAPAPAEPAAAPATVATPSPTATTAPAALAAPVALPSAPVAAPAAPAKPKATAVSKPVEVVSPVYTVPAAPPAPPKDGPPSEIPPPPPPPPAEVPAGK